MAFNHNQRRPHLKSNRMKLVKNFLINAKRMSMRIHLSHRVHCGNTFLWSFLNTFLFQLVEDTFLFGIQHINWIVKVKCCSNSGNWIANWLSNIHSYVKLWFDIASFYLIDRKFFFIYLIDRKEWQFCTYRVMWFGDVADTFSTISTFFLGSFFSLAKDDCFYLKRLF